MVIFDRSLSGAGEEVKGTEHDEFGKRLPVSRMPIGGT